MNTLWYFPLEILNARYTAQLCGRWMPEVFFRETNKAGMEYKVIEGASSVGAEIKVGQVLDAVGRGVFSMQQCANFLNELDQGNVNDGDVIFLQDFWTPGLESIWYALDLYGLKVRVYSMLHAQSVDEYDFTYPMRNWMRHYELGLDRVSTGIFVASECHKKQLRDAGFTAPIHVVALPLGYSEVRDRVDKQQENTENAVMFPSRIDKEKNPLFMLRVAEEFLKSHPDWKWYVTTSGKKLRSNMPEAVPAIMELAERLPQFIVKEGLTKNEYYQHLSKAKIVFNAGYQDYVSWTLLEASTFGCDLCYPDFRSFPECVPNDRRFELDNLGDALRVMDRCIAEPRRHDNIPKLANKGRNIEAEIVVNGIDKEYNIWTTEKIG